MKIIKTGLFLISTFAVVSLSRGARRSSNGTITLPVKERYRRLIPYMTFYLHQDGGGSYRPSDSNQVDQSRYQGYNQGYNHGFVHNGQQNGYVPQYQLPGHSNYYLQGPGPSVVKQVAQNYVPAKNRPSAPRQQFTPQSQVQPPQHPRLPQQPKFLTGFKPMDPNAITITQSQEIPVQQSTTRPYEVNHLTNSQRPFLIEQNSLRPYVEQESQRPQYVNQESESPRPYVSQALESPRPYIIAVEPNSQPHLPHSEQSSQRPFVQYVTTTYKPQYYTPVSNHIYPTPSPDYDNQDDGLVNGYDISRVLPTRITSDNLESSIKTLSKLLQILQKANALPQSAKKLTKVPAPVPVVKYPVKVKPLKPQYVDEVDEEGSTPGKPGVDYPAYTKIPQTSFSCQDQRYKGFFGDPETNCQVWHYCDLNGGQASFLCPNGTIFSQVALTCDWWFNVKCASTAQLYVLNERLYKYIIPQKPSFPEDFQGPLVDRYLEQKYRELEEQRTRKNSTKTNDDDDIEEDELPAHETNEARRSIQF